MLGLGAAAALWGSAAVGAACGAHHIGRAPVVTLPVLAVDTLLRPLVDAINRAPLDESTADAGYAVRAVVNDGDVTEARDLLVETPEAVHSPVRDVPVEERGPDESELVPDTIDAEEIEAAIRTLEASSLISQTSRTSATSG